MRNLEIKKFAKVETLDSRDLKAGITAFQLIEYTLNFYGNEITNTLDTKIMEDGRQIVIDGDGFIKAGEEIK